MRFIFRSPDLGTDHVNRTLHMADTGGFITAVLFHTPNQPLIFTVSLLSTYHKQLKYIDTPGVHREKPSG